MTARSGAFDVLSISESFRKLDPEDQEKLAQAFAQVNLPGGATIMVEGDEADAMYLVGSGRLRATVRRGGVSVPVGEIGPGEVVGEMSLLSDRPRSATVLAIRDTQLWRLSKTAFVSLVHDHPSMLLDMTRLLVTRLHRTNRAVKVGGRVTSLVLLPVDPALDSEGFCDSLVSALGPGAFKVDRRAVADALGSDAVDAPFGSPLDPDISRWISRVEADSDLLVYLADSALTPWTRRCIRQADLVHLVTTSAGDGVPSEAERALVWEAELESRPRVELTVVHRQATPEPSDTARLLVRRPVDQYHHVRQGSQHGLERLCRVVKGTAVSLVLGGGGARGFAHLGVLKALRDCEIPIDFVGGTSIGASAAAGIAMGWSVEENILNAKRVTVDRGSLIDLTPPVVALSTGASIGEGLAEVFGERRIEDLRIPYFCVSTDLTMGTARVHSTGSLWRAVRSSIAIPGTFPPMKDEQGHVLVDGGVVNNLPVDIMAQFAPGSTTLAVDLRASAHLVSADLPEDGVVSGWGVLGSRINPRASDQGVPRIIDILLRANEVASSPHGVEPDLLFTPPVESFGVLDFSAWEKLVDVGYKQAIEVLETWSETSMWTDRSAM